MTWQSHAGAAVEAGIGYLGPMDSLPYFHARDHARDNLCIESHRVPITDARELRPLPVLEYEGFTLVPHRSRVRDFRDGAAIARTYAPEIATLIRHLTGAEHVSVQGAVLRFGEREPHPELINSLPARFVHIDYSAQSFHEFAARAVATRADRSELLAGRYAAYNIWRVLTPPPQDVPLAVCAAPSVAATDRVIGEARIDPESGDEIRFGSTLLRFNPAHRWYFYRDMRPDEALVFKAFDSDARCVQGCPHCAFDDPRVPDGVAPRASVEIRAIAYWRC